MNVKTSAVQRIFFTMVIALAIGAIFIIAIGENPIHAYAALFNGAFKGKLGFGNTIANFTPLLLTSIAFAVAAKAGAFNVGVEGEVFLGGLAAAWVGIYCTFLPKPLMYVGCFLAAMLVAGAWATIPAVLKAYYGVNEVCTTILMNTVAVYITSYFVSGPMSAGTATPQSHPVNVKLFQFMKPSNANVGVFIALVVVILVGLMLHKTKYGYKIQTVGSNPTFSNCVGIDAKKVFVRSMILSGVIGGIAGCIEVLGVHGCFLNNFAVGLGSNGMLAALIARSSAVLTPFMAFFLAILKSGAMGMQQSTGVSKALIDTITAIFIIFATMETLFVFKQRAKAKKQSKSEGEAS